MKPCLVCGGELGPSALPGLLACRRCGFVTADVELSAEELRRLYGADYFAGAEYLDYVGERPVMEKHFQRRLRRLLPYVPQAASGALLEIGAAYGFFLHVARPHFAWVEGVDIAADPARYARETLGLPVREADFLEVDLGRRFDVACLWDTVEHLPHPDRYLDKLSRLMPPGGIVALTTGDIGSLVARWRGARWRQIHPPTHLHYFSRATLARLLDRHGFDVAFSGYDGVYRSADTMAYIVLALKGGRPAVYQRLKQAGVLDWTLYLNLYDIMFVVARRR